MVSTNAISAKQEQVFLDADIDDDGYLTQSEFEEGLPNEDFSVFDKNGDGRVSKEEYYYVVFIRNFIKSQVDKLIDKMGERLREIFKEFKEITNED